MTDRLPQEFDPATERQVRVIIGEGPSAQTFFTRAQIEALRVVADSHPVGTVDTTYVLEVHLPDSVAEVYRQQGRRQLQSEFRGLLNVAPA